MEQIEYSEIMKLGFSEEKGSCNVFYRQFGYSYSIVKLYLTNKIYIDWEKQTRLCKMVRLKKKTGGDIENEMPIQDLDQLKNIIHFFKEKKKRNYETFEETIIA